MKIYRHVLAVLLAMSVLLSMVTPAAAQLHRPVRLAEGLPAQTGPSAIETTPQRTRDRFGVVEIDAFANLPAVQWRDRTHLPAISPDDKVVGSAFAAGGAQMVSSVIYLNLPSPARLRSGGVAAADVNHLSAEIAAAQSQVEAAVAAAGGQTLYRFTTLSSGLAVLLPARAAGQIAALPGVVRISQVRDYQKHLGETVPFIGAELLQELGVTGAGVKVAVIDSGVDFTHLGLGGPGTLDAYDVAYFGNDPDCNFSAAHDPDCAYAKAPNPALFGPDAPKVKGGYDFLGEAWTGGANSPAPLPDPNPIDWEGHGTHVAHIIAGVRPAPLSKLYMPLLQGPGQTGAGAAASGPAVGAAYKLGDVSPGVAPGAHIYAYKACASFTSACNGLALLKSVDKAVEDGVDIINLSLGSPYGLPEDDLTHFTNEAVAAGVIVVASAGNSADKPFIAGSPSIGDGVISVAQTTVPSALRYPLTYASTAISGVIDSAVFQNWSVTPGATPISGTVVYGNADNSNLNGCAPYVDDMTGKVVLADRGDCTFTLKAKHASAAGASLALIGLIAPGEPFEGGDGGDSPITIPTFMIAQDDAALIKAQIPFSIAVGIDPANTVNLAYSMVGSSSRGPRSNDNRIKPDIGAPGASVSALVGTGNGVGPFGGTSGAAPMVSGVAALVREAYGASLTPAQVKALLMNSANLDIWQDEPGGTPAAITRIGAGQVDAAAAYSSTLIAWDSTDSDPLKWTGSLSFGYVPTPDRQSITRTLTIQNLSNSVQSVDLAVFFRFADDEHQGVRLTPQTNGVLIAANGTVTVPVRLDIYAAGNAALTPPLDPVRLWGINKGAGGADGNALTTQEVDGWIELQPQLGPPIHVVWHVLPKAVADTTVAVVEAEVTAQATLTVDVASSVVLTNTSPGITGTTDVFDLVEVSPNIHNFTVGDCEGFGAGSGCNLSPIDIKEVGVRAYTFDDVDFLEFAVTLHDHPYRAGQFPVGFDIYIDADSDGSDDYVIFNNDFALTGGDGRNGVFVVDLAAESQTPVAKYFIDSTFNTQNHILMMDAAAVGVTFGTPFSFKVFAFDNYFGSGPGGDGGPWDCAPAANCADTQANEVFVYTPGKQRFVVAEDDQILNLLPDSSTTLTWTEPASGATDSPAQIGLLFLHRFAPIGHESDAVQLVPPAQVTQTAP